MLGKDDLCSMLVSTLVANDLFLTGHKILRKGMTRTPLSSKEGKFTKCSARERHLPAKCHWVTVKLLLQEMHSNSPNN